MIPRILATLVFTVLMTISIAGSALIVVFFYLPMVVLKAVCQLVAGKASPRVAEHERPA